MVSIQELQTAIAKLRKVSSLDIIAGSDHNDLVDVVNLLGDLVSSYGGFRLFTVLSANNTLITPWDYLGTDGAKEEVDLSPYIPVGAKFAWVRAMLIYSGNPPSQGSWYNEMSLRDSKYRNEYIYLHVVRIWNGGQARTDGVGFVPLFDERKINVSVSSSPYQNQAQIWLLGYAM